MVAVAIISGTRIIEEGIPRYPMGFESLTCLGLKTACCRDPYNVPGGTGAKVIRPNARNSAPRTPIMTALERWYPGKYVILSDSQIQ